MQASCRLLLPVNQGAGVRRRDRLCVSRGRQRARCRQATIIRNAVGSSPGGGVLDRPVVLPGEDPGKVRVKKRPPLYRTMLHDDSNRREYVVTVLLKVIDGMTAEDAINIMQEAHENGLACVIVCPQEDAERYCEALRMNGLTSTVEPASSGKGTDEPAA